MKHTLINGNVIEMLRQLPDESVDCVITSPPYYGLRDYSGVAMYSDGNIDVVKEIAEISLGEYKQQAGNNKDKYYLTDPEFNKADNKWHISLKYDNSTIWGGDINCEHEWNTLKTERKNGSGGMPSDTNLYAQKLAIKGVNNYSAFTDYKDRATYSNRCSKCNAWKGQLGLELDYRMYIEHLIIITNELKRVLKPTGTLFWNMGDTYSGSNSSNNDSTLFFNSKRMKTAEMMYKKPYPQSKQDIPAKSLMALPERFIINMIDNNWILRNKIIWRKPNGMPSSAKDRLTNKWEHIFFFAKNNNTVFWINELTKEIVSKNPLGIHGQEGKDWVWIIREANRSQYEIKEKSDYISSKGWEIFKDKDGNVMERKRHNLWDGWDYYFDLDSIRKPIADPDRMNRAVSGKRYSSSEAIQSFMGKPHQGIYKPRPNVNNSYDHDVSNVQKRIIDDEQKDVTYLSQDEIKLMAKHYSGKIPKENAEMYGSPRARAWRDVSKQKSHQTNSDYSDLDSNDTRIVDTMDIPHHPKGDPTIHGMRLPPQIGQKGSVNPNGANPGDVIDEPAVRYKSWASNPGHPFTHERKYDLYSDGGDFFDIPTKPHKFAHFAVFPESVVEPLIKVGCPSDGVVLDPFAGSGTTGVVAKKLSRSSILIEISPEYCEIIKRRMNWGVGFDIKYQINQ